MNKVDNIVNEVLESQKISIREFGRRTGMNHSFIARVANGEDKVSYRLAYQISKAFNIDLDYIIAKEGLN